MTDSKETSYPRIHIGKSEGEDGLLRSSRWKAEIYWGKNRPPEILSEKELEKAIKAATAARKSVYRQAYNSLAGKNEE